MKIPHRVLRLAVIAAALTLAVARDAQAGHAYGRHKHDWDDRRHACAPVRYVPAACATPVVRYVPVACPAPAVRCLTPGLTISFAGQVGGVTIGATVLRPLGVGYAYVDPFCGEAYASYSDYARHCRYAHHPYEVQVQDVRYRDHESYSSWERR